MGLERRSGRKRSISGIRAVSRATPHGSSRHANEEDRSISSCHLINTRTIPESITHGIIENKDRLREVTSQIHSAHYLRTATKPSQVCQAALRSAQCCEPLQRCMKRKREDTPLVQHQQSPRLIGIESEKELCGGNHSSPSQRLMQ
jgi:hypothetical protein